MVGAAIQFHGVFSLLTVTECAFGVEDARVVASVNEKERISPQRKNEVDRERGEFEG